MIKEATAEREAQLEDIKRVDKKIIEEVRQQCSKEVSRLRTQLRRQVAAARESSEEAERLRTALAQHFEEMKQLQAHVRQANQQVRFLLTALMPWCVSPDMLHCAGGKWKATNPTAVTNVGTNRGAWKIMNGKESKGTAN
mgnify:CR=1 FL=1